MGQKVLGFENKIKFHHILARIFFSSHPHFKITVLVSYPREDQQKAQHSVSRAVRTEGPRGGGGGQLPPPDFGRNRSKTLSINMPWITNHSPFPIFRPSNGPALSQLGPFMRAMPDRRTWQGRMVWVLTKSSTNHVFICGPL